MRCFVLVSALLFMNLHLAADETNVAKQTKWSQATELCRLRGITEKLSEEVVFSSCRIAKGAPPVKPVMSLDERERCAEFFLGLMGKVAKQAAEQSQRKFMVDILQAVRRQEADEQLKAELESK